MEVPCRVSVRRGTGTAGSSSGGPVILDIAGDDLGLLIGWRGETLRSLQTAVNLMLGEEGVETRRVILDVERYRARREDQVRELAQRLALRVKRTGEPYTLDPMHAYERRVIHMTLAEDPDVTTESTGREPARRVVINPTGPAQGGPPERFEGARQGRSVRAVVLTEFAVESLSGGTRLTAVPLPGRASVAIAFMVGVGSRYESESQSGISHFVEHMVFKGGSRYPTARDVSEAIEGVGGVLNAATDREATVFWTRVPVAKLGLAVSVLSDMLLTPGARRGRGGQGAAGGDRRAAHVPGQPAGLRPDRVRRADVAGASARLGRRRTRGDRAVVHRADCRTHLEQHLLPSTLVVSISGGFEDTGRRGDDR